MKNYVGNMSDIKNKHQVIEVNIQKGKFKGRLQSTPIWGDYKGYELIRQFVDEQIIYNEVELCYKQIGCRIETFTDQQTKKKMFRWTMTDDEGVEGNGVEECSKFGQFIVGVNIFKCVLLSGVESV